MDYNFKKEFCNKAEEMLKDYCITGVKEAFFKDYETARRSFLSDYQDNMNELFDCPVKTAFENYGKVNENTIEIAWKEGIYNPNIIDEFEQYPTLLNRHNCKLLHQSVSSIKDVKKRANILRTLGINKNDFVKEFHPDNIQMIKNKLDFSALWDRSLSCPKGFYCQKCCKIKTSFDDKGV